MTTRIKKTEFLLISFLALMGCKKTAPIHHELYVQVDLQKENLQVRDTLTLHLTAQLSKKPFFKFAMPDQYPPSQASWVNLQHPPPGLYIIHNAESYKENSSLSHITLRKPDYQVWPDQVKLVFNYQIPLPHASKGSKDPGYFSSDFYPRLSIEENQLPPLVTFGLETDSPEDWKTVSQGNRIKETVENGRRHTIWISQEPMEAIHLALGCFVEYERKQYDRKFYAFLRNPNPDLAKTYLDVTGPYIEFYEKLIGPYPYHKFALIENGQQIGYGMPSFTLLGSRVIRFPFIRHTSYPHEILHNWWGNSVYIDPRFGNWAEGLTTYLADHLLIELKGKGALYRFQQLVRYLNYVSSSKDFPLTEFTSRQDMASQAVGYGKMLMLFHMLRREIGDEAFLQALRKFYRASKFRYANLEDLRKAFESVSGKNLEPFFLQWTTRSGAPELELVQAEMTSEGNSYRLHLNIHQKQANSPFAFTLPIGIWNENGGDPEPGFQLKKIFIDKNSHSVTLDLKEKPGKVVLDPYHDLFQKLHREEVPPSIGQTYGADKAVIIQASQQTDEGVSLFTKSLSRSMEHIHPILDDSNPKNPPLEALWVVGKNNLVGKRLTDQFQNKSISISKDGVTVEGKQYPWKNHGFVFTLNHPDSKKRSATWVIPGAPDSVPGLIRKLPHYGKFGYMVFEGKVPLNRVRGTWPANRSRLAKIFQSGRYPLPSPRPLVNFQPNLKIR